MGAHHARFFGLAKSFDVKLSDSEMVQSDHEVIGASTIIWAFIKAVLPMEMTSRIEADLARTEIGRIATRNVMPDMFLQFLIIICA